MDTDYEYRKIETNNIEMLLGHSESAQSGVLGEGGGAGHICPPSFPKLGGHSPLTPPPPPNYGPADANVLIIDDHTTSRIF